jgi:hypothetical protein
MGVSFLSLVLGRFKDDEKRDRQFINQLNIRVLNSLLWPLYVGFICLNFLDVYSTLLAMNSTHSFRELNPIAAVLFGLQFHGFLLATIFKYLPAIPLFYTVFAGDSSEKYVLEIRLIKFAGLAALVASDILLVYVVGINNIPEIVKLASARP